MSEVENAEEGLKFLFGRLVEIAGYAAVGSCGRCECAKVSQQHVRDWVDINFSHLRYLADTKHSSLVLICARRWILLYLKYMVS